MARSCDVSGRSTFTNLLLAALHGGAADIAGRITPGSLYTYIDQALGAWDPRPIFKTYITRFIAIKTTLPKVPHSTFQKITKYFRSKDDRFQLDPSFEYTNSPSVPHEIIEPYADPGNVSIFKDLQLYQSVGLVTPVGATYMYFAAMESKSCKLTALGAHYWQLIRDNRHLSR